MVEFRETHIPRQWLLCPSFRDTEVCISSSSSVQLQACPRNPCLVRQVPIQLQHLSPHTLFSHMTASFTTDRMPPSLLHQATGRIAPRSRRSSSLTGDSMAESPSLLAQAAWPNSLSFSLLSFKCSAQNFPCHLISGPSYDVLLLPIPPYLLPSFSCHLWLEQEFPMTRASTSPGYVMSHWMLSESHMPLALGPWAAS